MRVSASKCAHSLHGKIEKKNTTNGRKMNEPLKNNTNAIERNSTHNIAVNKNCNNSDSSSKSGSNIMMTNSCSSNNLRNSCT